MYGLISPSRCRSARRPRPRLCVAWNDMQSTPPDMPVPERPVPVPPEVPEPPRPMGPPPPMENPLPLREPPTTLPPES